MTREQEYHEALAKFYPTRDEAWASNRDVRAAEDAVDAARANWRDERDEAALVAAREALAAAKKRSEELWARSEELCAKASRAYRRWVEERDPSMNFCAECRADIPDTEENEGVYLCATCAREHDTPAEGYARGRGDERSVRVVEAAEEQSGAFRNAPHTTARAL